MEMHKRRYIKLSVALFALSFLFSTYQFLTGWDSVVGDVVFSSTTGAFTLFISFAMAFMGIFYLLKE
jgi:hypothetical protein